MQRIYTLHIDKRQGDRKSAKGSSKAPIAKERQIRSFVSLVLEQSPIPSDREFEPMDTKIPSTSSSIIELTKEQGLQCNTQFLAVEMELKEKMEQEQDDVVKE